MSVTLEEAHALTHEVLEKARTLGLRVGVAVVNEKGGTVLIVGMDGTRPFTPDTAKAKALGTVLWGRSGASLAHNAGGSVFEFVNRMYGDRVIYAEGSALLQRDGTTEGAVGVSGAMPAQDEELAAEAAAGYG